MRRESPVTWHLRSTDLMPFDMSLWSYVKNATYACAGQAVNLHELKHHIILKQ
jgi:hypothetical protein